MSSKLDPTAFAQSSVPHHVGPHRPVVLTVVAPGLHRASVTVAWLAGQGVATTVAAIGYWQRGGWLPSYALGVARYFDHDAVLPWVRDLVEFGPNGMAKSQLLADYLAAHPDAPVGVLGDANRHHDDGEIDGTDDTQTTPFSAAALGIPWGDGGEVTGQAAELQAALDASAPEREEGAGIDPVATVEILHFLTMVGREDRAAKIAADTKIDELLKELSTRDEIIAAQDRELEDFRNNAWTPSHELMSQAGDRIAEAVKKEAKHAAEITSRDGIILFLRDQLDASEAKLRDINGRVRALVLSKIPGN